MRPSRIKQLTAVGDDTYEVVLDGSVEPSTILCTVDMSGVVPGVSVRPDPFMLEEYGDPRPIMATIIAMHRARRAGDPGQTTPRGHAGVDGRQTPATAAPPGPHPNWDFATNLLSAVVPGSTGYSPDRIAGHAPADWRPFDLETREMDAIENDLLDHCSEMTGPLIVVNDTSFASSTFRRGPYLVEASKLRDFVKNFGDRVGSYFMDGHVIIVSPVTGLVVIVQDDELIATVRGRSVMQTSW